MASGTLTGIHKNTNPQKPGEPMPPRPRAYFDDTAEESPVAEVIGEDLSDALCSELNGEEGDGANSAKRGRVQEHPVTQTPVIASDISPGDTNRPSMPAEKKREGHDHGRGNTDVRPDAEDESHGLRQCMGRWKKKTLPHHCRSSMEERNQYQDRTGFLGRMVAGETCEEDGGEVHQMWLPISKSTKKWYTN
ncbi:uncharacterized protein LOC124164437 [Ischnura elegans]|uniref:uncharacterized protein LOC124164437 n=1 Tax=Ischnura elegans TaxID=197161 RepID=UPI001ED8A29D|nr:uncharacterized protein LOC124164437 [Ischnura elegans]